LRLILLIVLALFCVPIYVYTADTPVSEDVVTVHFDRLGSPDAFETNAGDIKCFSVIGYSGRMSFFQIRNLRLTPREVTVKILGLTEPEYDLYIGGGADKGSNPDVNPVITRTGKPPIVDYKCFLKGKHTREDLEAGIKVKLPGTDVPSDYRDYFGIIRERCATAAQHYVNSTDKDGITCWAALGERGIVGWIDNLEKTDLRYRTVDIAISPVGRSISLPGVGMMPLTIMPSKMAINHGNMIQKVRREIDRTVKNKLYKSDTLEAMTPVDIIVTVPEPLRPGVAGKVRVQLLNRTDRKITGTVKPILLSGWQSKPASASVSMLGYGKNAGCEFLITLPKGANPDTPISINASLSVEGVQILLAAKSSK